MALHHHHHHPALVARDDDVQTVVSIVYVTQSATFDGPIGGYITLKPEIATTAEVSSAITASVDSDDISSTTTSTATTPVIPIRSHRPGHKSSTVSSSTVDIITATPSSYAIASTLVTESSSSVQATTFVASIIAASSLAESAVSTSSATSAAITAVAESSTTEHLKTSDGMSGGAKAGTTIAVLLAIAALSALAFFFYRRKKSGNGNLQEIDDYDEKTGRHFSRGSMGSRFSLRHSYLKAPRLSLGPLNHIFPVASEKSSNQPTNPFNDPATVIVSEKNHPMLPQDGPSVAAVVPKPLSFKSDRADQNASGSSPTSNGRSSVLSPQSNNVHRVQLEFKPSMDDELELRPGQLVRMLHEYDDGWALCVRLDRSQQGVVPRTCISKMPLKPRPSGPPPAGLRHGQRNGQRMSPAGSTSSMTSYTSDNSMPPPLSPGNGRMRSESNSSYLGQTKSGQFNNGSVDNRPRSNSASDFEAPRGGPAATSPLNPTSAMSQANNMPRKPVPGQAL